MRRKSEDITVTNKALYKELAPLYLKIIKKLQKKFPVYEDKFFADLVNFKQNKTTPKHKWFIYKQGYAEALVKEILKREARNKNDYVLDPFSGVGTTNVVAQELGYKSIGFDINPVAILAAKVKTSYFSKKEISRIKDYINNFFPTKSKSIPDSPLLESSFSKKVFDELMQIKGFYENIKDEKISDFFKLAYLSIIEDCSNRIKDGNGIKISKTKKIIQDAKAHFLHIAFSMIVDIDSYNFNSNAVFYNASLINDFKLIQDKKIGISIFSPPYANCFDYCEVYKLELWMGGFVLDYADFKKYRDIAVRSHVNSKFDHSIKNENQDVNLIADLLSCFNLWNKNIPDMVRGYFDDMTNILKRIFERTVDE